MPFSNAFLKGMMPKLPQRPASNMVITLLVQNTELKHFIASYSTNPIAFAELLESCPTEYLQRVLASLGIVDKKHRDEVRNSVEGAEVHDQVPEVLSGESPARSPTQNIVVHAEFPPFLLNHRPKAALLQCGYDIRRTIYDYLFPAGRHIHLTHPTTTHLAIRLYALQSGSRSLMMTCKQLYEETASLVFGQNTFYFTPREANFNAAHGRYPHASSDLWLCHMRTETKQLVKRLKINIKCPREEDVENIANGLKEFHSLEIEFSRLGLVNAPERYKQYDLIGALCKAISEKRTGLGTIWYNSGDVTNAMLLHEYLPTGFEENGPTWFELLESQDAWV